MGLNYNDINFSREITNKYKIKCRGLYALDNFDEVIKPKSLVEIKPKLNIMYKI